MSVSVLLQETHDESREALQTLLEAFGYSVLSVIRHTEVFPAVEAQAFQLIILRGDPDAVYLCSALKADLATATIPVMVLLHDDSIREKLRKSGADYLLDKPLDVRSFLDQVRKILPESQPQLDVTRSSPVGIVVVWDPAVVGRDDYADLVEALGDLVRIGGGRGIRRIRDQGFAVTIPEIALT